MPVGRLQWCMACHSPHLYCTPRIYCERALVSATACQVQQHCSTSHYVGWRQGQSCHRVPTLANLCPRHPSPLPASLTFSLPLSLPLRPSLPLSPSLRPVSISMFHIDAGAGTDLGFEVLGADNLWHVTPISKVPEGGTSLLLGPPLPAGARAVRYLWRQAPCGNLQRFACPVYVRTPALGNASGEHEFLPLGPFIANLSSTAV